MRAWRLGVDAVGGSCGGLRRYKRCVRCALLDNTGTRCRGVHGGTSAPARQLSQRSGCHV